MNEYQELVEEFHINTASTVGGDPAIRDRELRARLIMEEAVETIAAMGFQVSAVIDEAGIPGERPHREIGAFTKREKHENFIEAIDGLCDLLYVVFGTAVAWGIDLDAHFYEVHRANMTKLKGEKRADGKQLKPEGWQPPNHKRILDALAEYQQLWRTAPSLPDMEVIG